ncbi:hypothetical protein [Providencia burhodogranariea]|uniref:Uncharacterized protein n=1 Tax=Providencia burhodogranariea DSM 19968 TaxID=1141662 RepID=K8WPZ4_9GAMM|nr:hypothetical protein OOA_06641 [Providencia burhodogranariea DSM 19968]
MSEKDSPETDEFQYVSYHIPKWMEDGKIHWDDLQLQHKSLNAEAECILPPRKVIPVIFIPGLWEPTLKIQKTKNPFGELISLWGWIPSTLPILMEKKGGKY